MPTIQERIARVKEQIGAIVVLTGDDVIFEYLAPLIRELDSIEKELGENRITIQKEKSGEYMQMK